MAAIGVGTAAFGHFVLGAYPDFGEALWSAIAHLVDPGSIGDDATAAERTIGLIQVIAGIVFFAGIVLTVLTEVVDRALRRLRKGDPAIRRRGHLLVVGFNPSLREIRRGLGEEGGRRPPEIVVMLPLAQADRREDARRALAGYPVRVAVVVADPDDDGFARVCASAARSIVVLSPEGEPDAADLEATDRATLLRRHLDEAHGEAPPVAVELRRDRSVRAFWYVADPTSPGLARRFPANFDALVNDRNIGGLFALAVTNPAFAAAVLADERAGPRLAPVADCAGLSFGEARARHGADSLLGVLAGAGPDAEATYLPDDAWPLRPEDRLITAPPPHPAARTDSARAPESVELGPAPPGPTLMIGSSDASRALVEDLGALGGDLRSLHLLDHEAPADFPAGAVGAGRVQLIEGDPRDPEAIAAAISRVEPEIVWVAAAEGNGSGAIVAGMLARQATDAPIVVEQSAGDRIEHSRRVAAGLIVVSTADVLADTVVLSLADPALLVAREKLLDDPAVTLESLAYISPDPLPLDALPATLGRTEAIPLAFAISDTATHLRTGDRVLALHRRIAADQETSEDRRPT